MAADGKMTRIEVGEILPDPIENPFNWTVSPDKKFVPVIVASMVAHPVEDWVESVIPWITGIGNEVTLRELAEEDPPPGAEFVTKSFPVPLAARSAAERATCSDVELTKVVGFPTPFHWTTELPLKPEPLRVTTAALPVATVPGRIEVSTGFGFTTCRLNGDETPPPGAGLETSIDTAAPVARDAPGTTVLISVALTYVDVKVLLFQRTVETGRKFVPTMSSVVEGLPADILPGEIDAIVGNEFTTLNGWPAEVPPPGMEFVIVIVKFPIVARSEAVRDTVICVALANVVGRALPLTLAVEVEMKPLPVSVTFAFDVPATIVEGVRLSSTGAGLSTSSVTVVLVVDPALFVTPTWSCPPDPSCPAGTVACNWVALTNTVGTWVLFTVTRLEGVKPVPEIVTISAELPTGTLLGVIDWIVRDGTGLEELFWEEPAPPHPTRGRQKIMQ
jgi:hypothetical protein